MLQETYILCIDLTEVQKRWPVFYCMFLFAIFCMYCKPSNQYQTRALRELLSRVALTVHSNSMQQWKVFHWHVRWFIIQGFDPPLPQTPTPAALPQTLAKGRLESSNSSRATLPRGSMSLNSPVITVIYTSWYTSEPCFHQLLLAMLQPLLSQMHICTC